jgi:predicted ATPase/DNA-binding CsgD family transcriptional regulator
LTLAARLASVLGTDLFSVVSARIKDMEPAGQVRLAAAGVTAREAEVLAMLGGRPANQEIAERLCISVRTVESHISALLRKLMLPGPPALIRLAQELAAEPVLPVPATSFVGREEELAQLRSLLAAGQLVCLTGPAGCGKTRLALEGARRWAGETRIAGLASVAAADVGAVMAAALGLSYEAADLAMAARVALAGRSVLLIADNCDQVVGAAAEQLTVLVRAVPGLHVVATSRQPLGVSEEQVLPVPPLACPVDVAPAAVQDSEAGRLFLDRARAASPRFRLDPVTAPHVAGLCQRLDGLPLAIELAASRVRTLDVATLADSLTRHLRLLERPAAAGRHRSLAAAIEWSWQLLDVGERDLLGRLAALPDDFTLAMAEAVAPAQAGADLETCLLRLVDRSLISATLASGQPARYRLLGTIRAFAAGRAPEVAAQVRQAHARYCCELAAAEVRARRQLSPAQPPPPPFDEGNYLAALTWAATHQPGLADRLLSCLAQLIGMQPSRRGIEVICAVASSDDGRWSSQALAWASWATTYLDLGQAGQLAARSAAAASGDRDQAHARWAAGWVHAYRHQESAALGYLDQVIAYAQDAAEPWLEASAWQARGVARGQAADAFRDFGQAAIRFASAGDIMHASNVRYMMASRAVETAERFAEVPVWLDECESYAAGHGYRHELAHIHYVRAIYERTQGRLEGARELLDRALPVFRQAGDFRCTTRTLLELADHHQSGHPAAATDLLLQGLGMAMLAGGGSLCARVLASLTTAAAATGDLPLAARALGALDALDRPQAPSSRAQAWPSVPADLADVLSASACAPYVDEGRAGGISLIIALYRADQPPLVRVR